MHFVGKITPLRVILLRNFEWIRTVVFRELRGKFERFANMMVLDFFVATGGLFRLESRLSDPETIWWVGGRNQERQGVPACWEDAARGMPTPKQSSRTP